MGHEPTRSNRLPSQRKGVYVPPDPGSSPSEAFTRGFCPRPSGGTRMLLSIPRITGDVNCANLP